MNTLDYFLKANLYGLLFAGCYWLLLRRHTFFSLNRAYLLLSAIASLVLPLVSLPTQTAETLPVPMGVIVLPVSAIAIPEETGPDWNQIGLIVYSLIGMLLVLRLIVHTARLMAFIRRANQQVFDDYVVVEPTEAAPTFSFFRYLVLNPADKGNPIIISHELVHIRQHHSLDVLGMALLRAVFWACPALWLIDRMLRQVHEFLADKAISQPSDYAHFLVQYTFGQQPDALVNGFFNPSLLKQRILMLHQKATTRWALGKYVLILPLALGLLAMTTAREQITGMVSQATDETITVSGRVTGADGMPLPGTHVVIRGTTIGTTTDVGGSYTLNSVSKNASLVFSFIGFDSQTIEVKGRKTINMVMKQAIALDETVVKAKPLSPRSSNPSTNSGEDVFTVVEQVPEFPGGMNGLSQYLTKSLRYPTLARKARVEGRVFVQFVITETGDIEQLRVLKSIGFGCDEEAVRVVSQMPKWNPGKQNGEAVSVQYNLPIQFQLEKAEDKRTGQVVNPKSDSSQRMNIILNTGKNARFALYNDVNPPVIRPPDSIKNSRLTIPLWDAGEPLFIIDGVEVKRDIASTNNKFPLGIRSLEPNMIESITVLKDASAIAAYGAKGKNGVVLITTKTK